MSKKDFLNLSKFGILLEVTYLDLIRWSLGLATFVCDGVTVCVASSSADRPEVSVLCSFLPIIMAVPPPPPPPAGFFDAAKDWYTHHLDELRKSEKDLPEPEKKVMEHQHAALDAIKHQFLVNRISLGSVIMPTGTGKSLLALMAPFVLGGHKVLIITPSKVISEQIYEGAVGKGDKLSVYRRIGVPSAASYASLLPSASIQVNSNIAAGHTSTIVIANAQKFGRLGKVVKHDDTMDKRVLNLDLIQRDAFSLIVIDEAHHYPSKSWKVVVDYFTEHGGAAKCLFLTATIPDGDGFPTPIFELPRAVAIDRKIIRPTEWSSVEPGDLAESLRALLTDNGRQAMVLTRRIATCNETAASLGMMAAPYHGTDLETNRKKFVAGALRILVVCGKLLEGFDHNGVSIAAFQYTTKSYIRFVQFVGRAVRIIRGNVDDPEAIIIGPETLKPFYERLDKLAEEDPEDDEEE